MPDEECGRESSRAASRSRRCTVEQESSVKGKTDTLKSKVVSSTYVPAVAASAALVPLAAFLGGVKLNNHNETVVRDSLA
jgi:hypothetical protein